MLLLFLIVVGYSTAVFENVDIKINMGIENSSLIVEATLKHFGYFGILYAGTMLNGDYTVIQVEDGKVTVKDFNSMVRNEPLEDRLKNVEMISSETDNETYVKVKYERKLNTYDGNDTVIVQNSRVVWSYAFRKGSLVIAKHNEEEMKRFTGILRKNYVFKEYKRETELIHGVVMTIAWCVLSDLSISMLFLIPINHKVISHIIFGTLVFLFTFVGYFITMNSPTQDNHHKLFPHHKNLGLVLLFWLVFQTIFGILSRTLQAMSIHPLVQYIIRLMHKCSGYLLVIITQIQVLIGWIAYDQTIAIVLISLWLVITISLLFLLNKLKYKALHKKEQFCEENAETQELPSEMKQLMKLPYCSDLVQKHKFFILNNNVYKYSNFGFHPGGRKLIELCNGRQIDVFFYGLSSHFYDLPLTKHRQQYLKLIQQPIGHINSSQLYEFRNPSFIVNKIQKIDKRTKIYYFKNVEAFNVNKVNDLEHVGQYFVINNIVCYSVQSLMGQGTDDNSGLLPICINSNDDFSKDSLVKIKGLKGRGFCLDSVQPGTILIITNGPGLLPFLNLIDIIYKSSIPNPSQEHYQSLISHFSFHFFISVDTISQLIIPSQILSLLPSNMFHLNISKISPQLSYIQNKKFNNIIETNTSMVYLSNTSLDVYQSIVKKIDKNKVFII